MTMKRSRSIKGNRYTPDQDIESMSGAIGSLFKAPSPRKVLPVTLLFSVLGSLVIFYPLHDQYLNGFLILFLPALFASLATTPLAKSVGGTMYSRRSTLLATIVLFLMLIALSFGRLLVEVFDVSRIHVLTYAFAVILWARHLILLTLSHHSHRKIFFASANQTMMGILLVFLILPGWTNIDILLALLFCSSFLLGSMFYTIQMGGPMRQSFGASQLALTRAMMDHMTEGGKAGKGMLERFFGGFSEEMDVPIEIASFRRPGQDKPKILLVLPGVHPGPFGTLGASDLSTKLEGHLQDLADHIYVPHGTTGHDLNLARSSDCTKIAKWVRNALHGLEYSDQAGIAVRFDREAKVLAQVIGNGVFLTGTFSPKATDDIEASVGDWIYKTVELESELTPVVMDAHNSIIRGSGSVYWGTDKAKELFEVMTKGSRDAVASPRDRFKLGYSEVRKFSIEKHGIGPKGIQAMVFEVQGTLSAYLMFDGNNMTRGLRELIMSEITDLVDQAEVMTSDNHIVNAIIGGINPVGCKADRKKLATVSRKLIQQAIQDLEPMEASVTTGTIRRVKVFGHGSTVRMTTVINAGLATLLPSAATSISLSLAFSLLSGFVLDLLL